LRVDPDLSHEEELRGSVSKNLRRIIMLEKVVGEHCFKQSDTVLG